MFYKNRFLAAVLLLFVAAGLGGCKSNYEKLLTGRDNAAKYRAAIDFYNARKYAKAQKLLQDLSAKYRATSDAEDLLYYFANTEYRLRNYPAARFQFKNFTDQYPNSNYAEYCRFMHAYCYYLESPRWSLDQANTMKAIESLQLFINLYPASDRADEAAKYLNDLRGKLERKAYEAAKLYLDLDDYKSAVIAFENALRDYPDTKYAEDMEFLVLKSQFLYADNSREYRQRERYRLALDYYNDFIKDFPEGKYLKEANKLKASSESGLAHVEKVYAAYSAEKIKQDEDKRKRDEEGRVEVTSFVPQKQ